MEPNVQTFTDELQGPVDFIDRADTDHSICCQPRDIELLTKFDRQEAKRLKTEIAVDIRLSQGMTEDAARSRLKYNKTRLIQKR